MAIKLIANYSKKLGLPGFSSHQYSISVEIELNTAADIPGESARIYQLLQSNVDEQMQSTGFVPPKEYGFDAPAPANVIHPQTGGPTNGNWPQGPAWNCSGKQKDLILKIVEEHQLDKAEVEALAVERFGMGVRLLNKIQASGLIDELLDTHGGGQRHDHGNRRDSSAYSGNRKGRAA